MAREVEKKLSDLKEAMQQKKKLPGKRIRKYDAVQIILDLLLGMSVGVFIGYKLDQRFGLKVTFSIIMTILGTVASILNIYRNLKKE